MSRKKVHIDKLFKEGLKDFSLFVSDRDFNAIDDKTSVFKDLNDVSTEKSDAFSNFELEISENDWLATKAKLDSEKHLIASDNALAGSFQDFTIEPKPEDWTITYDKYKKAKRRRVAFWWLSTGILIFLLGTAALLTNFSSTDPISSADVSNASNVSDIDSTIQNSKNTVYDENTKTNTQETEQASSTVPEQNSFDPDHAASEKGKFNNRIKPRNTPSAGNTLITSAGDANLKSQPAPLDPQSKDASSSADATKAAVQQKNNYTLGDPVKIGPVTPEPGTTPEPEITPKDTTKKSNPSDDDKPRFTPLKQSQFYLAMVNQVDYTYRLLGGSNNPVYNAVRNQSDKAMLQYTGGIEFGVIAGSNQFSAGLTATSQTWKSDYNYTYKLFDSIPFYDTGRVLKGYFLFPKKDTTMNESRSVTLTKIQLPLNYSRLWQLNERLSISTGLGAVLSYTVKAEGDKIISHDNKQLYYYSRLKHQEQAFNIAPALALGGQYRLSNQWMMSATMGGNMYLRSRFKSSFNAKDHPYSVGINFKLIYLLK